MERYETLFAQLKNRQEGAFVPFVTLGDPGPEQSLKIIDALIEGGADALELGIPFSDPLADGPTIQGAALRAFAAGFEIERLGEALQIALADLRGGSGGPRGFGGLGHLTLAVGQGRVHDDGRQRHNHTHGNARQP